ncbi:MAG: discoidin domain-containing protein, partial [Armatimonadota bacterium]
MNSRSACLLLALLCVLPAFGAEDGASGRPQAENVALGKTMIFNTPPNYPDTTDPEDALQLVDGKLASAVPMWYKKSVVGWVSVDPTVFTLDLGAIQPIGGVRLHMGAGQAGVEWPASIQVYVSDDGQRYSHVGNLMDLLATPRPATGYAAFWLVANKLETHGRFVKFVCSQINLGTGAYIMLDEVEVYKGEAQWLTRPLTWPETPEQWQPALEKLKWQAEVGSVPFSERPRRLTVVDQSTPSLSDSPAQWTANGKSGFTFALNGEAGRPRSMFWTTWLPKPISTEKCRYARLSYRAEGIRRTYEPKALVALQGVNDKNATNEVALLEANMALNDGEWHTLVRPLPEGFTLQQLRVSLYTESDRPSLSLGGLELLSEAPAEFGTALSRTGFPFPEDRQSVKLGAALNGSLSAWYDRVISRYGMALDGARALPEGQVLVSGCPFLIGPADKNLALMPEAPEKNERVQFLGQTVDSHNLDPISRDDVLSVEVDANAREAFLLLAMAAPPIQPRYGLPFTALRLDDIECLAVELTYDRGPSEEAFPYSLADRGCYIPCRELGAYAVAVDPTRRLKKVTLRNNQFGQSFALAGLTLNTGEKASVPQLTAFPAPETLA